MGLLVEGRWQAGGRDARQTGGRFVRQDAQFRDWISADGSSGFAAQPGRYHLYVSFACPWAHRTLIFRTLKGLKAAIEVSVVHPFMGDDGWSFAAGQGVVPDPLNGAEFMRDVYLAAAPRYSGRCSVPVLWDKERQTIVSNESSEIIRMFNSSFDGLTDNNNDYYPVELSSDIDVINETVYANVNNGVYRTGFAATQKAYEEAFDNLFNTLDDLEERLAQQRYLVGDRLTEADWRLFSTLLRFDIVYYGHFKCNKKHIYEYPNLWNFTLELYQHPGVAEVTNFDHIKRGYYHLMPQVNPLGIVAKGPALDFNQPHERDKIMKA